MKSSAFTYVCATSVADAVVQYQATPDARYLAGGQSLMAALNFRLDAPGVLIDLSRIAALKGVRRQGDALFIGAMTCHADLAADPLVARHLPLFAEAVRHVAHPAIRNRGTIGGSLALADPAAELPACALATGAILHVEGPQGGRAIAADDYFLGMYETALIAGEVLTEIEVPLPDPSARHAFAELSRRSGDYAMTGLALMTGPLPRVVWFGLSDRPVRALAAEQALVAGNSDEAIRRATDGIEVLGDQNASAEVKRHLARVLLGRALRGGGLA